MLEKIVRSLFIANVKQEGDIIYFQVSSTSAINNNIYFACDIFANGQRIHKIHYQRDMNFSFHLSKSSAVDIKIYMLDKHTKERQAKILQLGWFYQLSPFYNFFRKEYLSKDLALRGKNLLEDGNLVVHDNFPSIAVETEKMNFGLDPYKNRTWRWTYLQFLFLNDIASYIEYSLPADITMKREIYYKGLNFIQDFSRYLHLNELEDVELWHDHGTALRVKNIAFYWIYGLSRGLVTSTSSAYNFLKCFIEKHLAKLADDKFYSSLTNHGFDQSLILLQVTCELDGLISENNYQHLATERIKQELSFVFTGEGGHKENSPAYLNFGLKQMMQAFIVESIYKKRGDLYNNFKDVFERASLLLAYTIKPDGHLPLVGDTALFKVNNIFTHFQPTCFNQYMYSLRQGKVGDRPKSNFLVLPKTGYVIARTWNSENFHKNFFFMFKNSHLSNYHRHDDDLSFILSDDGEDWFIDGGIYKYEPKSPHRIYIRSAKSHNVSMPKLGKVNRQIFNISNGININNQTQNNIHFSAKTSMYVGYNYERKVTLDLQHKCLTLSDKLEHKDSVNKEDFITRFFIAADKQVNIQDSTVTIQGKYKNIKLNINSQCPYTIHLVKVEQEKIDGWLSSEIATLHQINLLEIRYEDIHTLDASYTISL